MELLVTLVSVQLLWVELERMALFVSLRNERLNEREAVTEKYNILMRFWVLPLPFPGH